MKILSFLWKYHFNLIILIPLHIIFLSIFISQKIVLTDEEFKVFSLSLLSLGATVVLFNLIIAFVPYRLGRAVLNGGLIFFYLGLCIYQWTRGAPLEASLFFDNFREIFSHGGLQLIGKVVGISRWLVCVGVLGLVIGLEVRAQKLSTFYRPKHAPRWIVLFLLLNVWFIEGFVQDTNPYSMFSKS